MDWTEFFKLTVLRETLQGPHRYFESQLQISSTFNMDELAIDEFKHLPLSECEKKLFTLGHRKLYLRHRFFRTPEFERITQNFAQRIASEKEQLLTFSTSGGGVYLFLNLQKCAPEILLEKRLICYTSEPPLYAITMGKHIPGPVHIIHHPHRRSYFRDFPSLWDKSIHVDLYRAHKA